MTKEEFRLWRKSRGLSQAELAVTLGVRRETVSKWESGVHEIPYDALTKMEAVAPGAQERKAMEAPAEQETRRWRPYPWGNRDYTLNELRQLPKGTLVWRLCLDVREPVWEVLKATSKGSFQYSNAPEIRLPQEAFPDPMAVEAPWARASYDDIERAMARKLGELLALHRDMGIPDDL